MTLEYVQIAVSKDDTRYNLTKVYRDTEYLVATDGHRLHFSNGMPKVEKGFFLDGTDAEFPNWSQVRVKSVNAQIEIGINKHDLGVLEAIAKTLKANKSSEYSVTLTAKNNKLTVTSNNSNSLVICYEMDSQNSGDFEIKLNLSYFLDAIRLPVKSQGMTAINIKFESAMSPIEIVTVFGTAIIMPLRK
jgi:DNA polymerase III sliding clamp (beta) subunit (PCNA family)